MNFKEIYYFSGKCLVLDTNPAFRDNAISTFANESFPFDKFIWLCDKHLILPTIYKKLQNSNVLKYVPIEISNLFENIYNLNKTRNLEIINQVEIINTKLENENISPVFLKGTGNLFDNIYSDIGERMIGDIDLLVRESDYLKTIETIISLGYSYEEKDFFTNELPKHFYRLYKNDVPANIEIHRIPVNIPFSKKFNTEIIFENRILAHGKQNIYVPSVEHRIIHNFIHTQLSNKGHWLKNNPLRDLYDFYLLSKFSNLSQISNKVEERNKFITYIFIYSQIFNIQQYETQYKSISYKLYFLLSNLYLKHSLFYKINLLFYNMFYLLPSRIILASKNKLYRKHILSKIKQEGLFQLFQKQ
jgi:hypothetical protein